MWDNVVGAHVRRANRNLAAISLVMVAVVALAGALSFGYLREVLLGPFTLDTGKVQAARGLDDFPNKFVTVQADGILGKVATVKTNGELSAEYYAYVVGEKFVIAKVDPGSTATTLTGVLREVESDEQREIFDDVDVNKAVLQGTLLKLILDTKQDFRTGGIAGLVAGVLIGLLGAFNLLRVVQRSLDPGSHPSARALGRYGDPLQTAMAIDLQARGPAVQPAVKNVTLTPQWLLRAQFLGFDAVRLDDIVWVYVKVLQNRAAKSYFLVVVERNRKTLEIPGKEQDVQSLGAALGQRLPWVLMGYSADLEKTWKSSPDAVIQAVDRRRAEAPAPAAPPVPVQ